MTRTLAVTLLTLTLGPAALAENWPEFRGPTGQGHAAATGLPTTWGLEQHVAWKTPIPGLGWSTPVIWDGQVFLTTAVPEGEGKDREYSLRALALDAAGGKVQWDVEVFREPKSAPKPHTKNSHASPTPVTDGKRLWVHFGPQGTACLDLGGKILWRHQELKYQPVHGNGGSPVLYEGYLFLSCDGSDKQFVAALDAATGKVIWQTPRPTDSVKKFAFGTPLVIQVNGKAQVISQGAGAVCAYEPADGKEIWRVTYDGYSTVPRPVFGHGLLYVATGYDTPSLLAIRPDGTGDVTASHVAWTLRNGAPRNASPLLVGQELYVVSDQGVATCVDAKTGKVHWQHRLGGKDCSASPVAANGLIYALSEDGTTTVFKAAKTWDQVAKNALGERALASPAVADAALFLRTEKHLYRIQE